MINEYALEPSLLNNWKDYRYFVEQFGISKGRLISRYPKPWKRMVYEALAGIGDREKKQIEEALRHIDDRMVARIHEWIPSMSWLANAEAEHRRRPFHAIIARDNPDKNSAVMKGDDIDETNSLWKNNTEIIVAREAHAMAQAVGPLLRISRDIIFVDPHFGPEVARFRNTVREFLYAAVENRGGIPLSKVEIHTSDKAEAGFFAHECKARLPALIPHGVTVRVVRWRARLGGETLHNRFILTDLGGVSFRYGLDEGNTGETDDISLLTTDVYRTRFGQYMSGQPAFEFVDEVFVVGR